MMINNKPFKSKRNHVWLDKNENCVCKQILPGADRPDPVVAANHEADILIGLYQSGVPVPRLFSCENGLLRMEYVKGLTLAEAIERAETDEAAVSVDSLAGMIISWFEKFYAAIPADKRRGDVNCRNFIITEDGCLSSVDFERLPAAARERDIGQMTAFILTYDPPYTRLKKSFSKKLFDRFIQRFDLHAGKSEQAQKNELIAMRNRR